MGKPHTAWVAGRARRVLQDRQAIQGTKAHQLIRRRTGHPFHVEPRDVRKSGRVGDQPPEAMVQHGGHDRRARAAVGDDARNARVRPV